MNKRTNALGYIIILEW